MKKVAFILIMSVRLLALLSIVVGICLWSGKFVAQQQTLIMLHFLLGFLTVADVLGLGIVALMCKQWALGILDILLMLGVPISGFKQIATIGPNMGGPQITHIVLVLVVLGLAEATAGRIKRAA